MTSFGIKSITIISLCQCQTYAEKNKNAFSAEIHHQTFETVLFKTHCRKQNKKIKFGPHIFPSFEGLTYRLLLLNLYQNQLNEAC